MSAPGDLINGWFGLSVVASATPVRVVLWADGFVAEVGADTIDSALASGDVLAMPSSPDGVTAQVTERIRAVAEELLRVRALDGSPLVEQRDAEVADVVGCVLAIVDAGRVRGASDDVAWAMADACDALLDSHRTATAARAIAALAAALCANVTACDAVRRKAGALHNSASLIARARTT